LWDLASGRVSSTLQTNGAAQRSVAFSADGALLAAAGADGHVKIWNVAKGTAVEDLSGSGAGVNVLAFAGTGRGQLVAGDAHSGIQAFDVAHLASR